MARVDYFNALVNHLAKYAKIEGYFIVLDQMSGSLHWTGGPLIIYATPDWDGVKDTLSISVVQFDDSTGDEETIDQYDLYVKWTGDLVKDLLLYRGEVEKAIRRAEKGSVVLAEFMKGDPGNPSKIEWIDAMLSRYKELNDQEDLESSAECVRAVEDFIRKVRSAYRQ